MCHTLAIDEGHFHTVARRDAVGAIGIVKESDTESVDIFYEWNQRIALQSIVICADMVDTDGVECRESASGRSVAGVKAMVVGRQKQVEPCIT